MCLCLKVAYSLRHDEYILRHKGEQMTTSKAAKSSRTQTKQSTGSPRAPTPMKASEKRSRGVPAPDHPPVQSAASEAASPEQNTIQASEALKKRELLQKLSDKTGLRKSRIRPVMDAMLTILGEAVAEERPLQLPPLGKLKPLRSKAQGGARISHVKIRQALTETETG